MHHRDDSLVGRTIAGKFAIEALIGSGAMGQVYRARQVALEKTIALKVLHADLAGDETFAARFHREAKAASRLDHPNSMRVIDFGAEPDGMLYIAMEFLDGRSLLRVMSDEGPLQAARVVDILAQALGALVVAHEMGVVHRDLKPENIMLLDGTDDEGDHVDVVKVCDFGIAKLCDRTPDDAPSGAFRGPLTTQGLVVGTPEYMSPEQGKGDPLDARSDLYSIGVMLFQLITGRLPFQAETALGLVFKQVNEPAPQPSDIRPGVDHYLEIVCLKALRKNPDERYQTAREMRAALRAFFPGAMARFPASMVSRPQLPRESLEQAVTQVMDPSGPSLADASAEVGAPLAATEAADRMALPGLPVIQPNVWVLGGLALLLGAGSTALAVTHWARPSGHPTPAASVAAESTSTVSSAGDSAGASSRAPIASASSHRPGGAPVKEALASSRSAGRASASRSAGPGAADPADAGTFSLETSVATPTVAHAAGVAAADVRKALPSWKLTACYRDALVKASKPLEGHVTLTLTIDGSGAISRAGARGVGSLLQATGDCMMNALVGVAVANVSEPGGTAEVDVACSPR